MYVGKIEIDREGGILHTSNDSYPLSPATTFSVHRPFLPLGIFGAMLLSAFGWGFNDILYIHELWMLVGTAFALFVSGMTTSQLVLMNRELRGSDLSVAAWGTYKHLNRIRRDLSKVANQTKYEAVS